MLLRLSHEVSHQHRLTTCDRNSEDSKCPICKQDVSEDQQGLVCTRCQVWSHYDCLNISQEESNELKESLHDWYCVCCQLIRANKIKWGKMEGEDAIGGCIDNLYSEIIGWKNNMFDLPRGKSGTEFIKELTRLINLFTQKTKWKRLAIPLSIILYLLCCKNLQENLKQWSMLNIYCQD